MSIWHTLMIKRNSKIMHQKPSQNAFQNLVNVCRGSSGRSHWRLSQEQHCQKWLSYAERVCRQVLHHSRFQCQQWPVSHEGRRNIKSTPCDYLYTISEVSIWVETDHLELLNKKSRDLDLKKNVPADWNSGCQSTNQWFIIPGLAVTFNVAIREDFGLIRQAYGKFTIYVNDEKRKAEEWHL